MGRPGLHSPEAEDPGQTSVGSGVRIQSNPIVLTTAPRSGLRPSPEVVGIGQDKTPVQHAGNVGFGLASLASVTKGAKALLRVTSQTPVARLIPGLNLGVAAIEGVNAFHMRQKGQNVVAATHLGNSVGCMASFLEESGAWAMASHHSTLGSHLALSGGLLGLGVGLYEIRLGTKIMKDTGSKRTLAMGILDAASGITSLVASRMGGSLGVGLLLGAGLIDLAGMGVDYYGEKIPFLAARKPK